MTLSVISIITKHKDSIEMWWYSQKDVFKSWTFCDAQTEESASCFCMLVTMLCLWVQIEVMKSNHNARQNKLADLLNNSWCFTKVLWIFSSHKRIIRRRHEVVFHHQSHTYIKISIRVSLKQNLVSNLVLSPQMSSSKHLIYRMIQKNSHYRYIVN